MSSGRGEGIAADGRTEPKRQDMKKIAQMTVLSALIGLGVERVHAQAANGDLMVNVALTTTSQSGGTKPAKSKITTKDLLKALGASSKAKLLLRYPVTGDPPFFVVRDGSGNQTVDTDLDPGLFNFTVAPGDYTTVITTTATRGNVNTETDTAITQYSFNNGGVPGFIAQGAATTTSDDKGSPGVLIPTKSSANVAGNGIDNSGNAAVVTGTIGLSGRKFEDGAEPGSEPPPTDGGGDNPTP